jgi:peptidyl-dipeptidase Dcp
MKKTILIFITMVFVVAGCSTKTGKVDNPFFAEYDTPFQTPPFDKVEEEHFMPAYMEAMKQNKAEIDAIINNPDEPTFENTIVAYDQAGEMLSKVGAVFGALRGAETTPGLQEIAREVTPLLTAHGNEIRLNESLFEKVKAVYDNRGNLDLNVEEMRLLEMIYRDFERSGAALPADKKEEYKEITERMSMISLQLSDNLLAETNNFRMVIEDEAELVGLSEDVKNAAAEQAKRDGMEGKWAFTLQKPSWTPLLTFSPRRDLREKLYRGYFMRGDNDNDYDNKALFAELIVLRDRFAKLLGYENFAAYTIDINMAKTPDNVYNFLQKVWDPALKVAKNERDDMQKIIKEDGGDYKLASWDWWYYSEKVRKAKYDLDEELVKPYFTIDNVREGIFYVANRLYGLTFERRNDIPVYHSEVETYEVFDNDGSHLAILYLDNHPRPGKRPGAWCGTFRPGGYKDGEKITPLVNIVQNFTRPSGDAPAMLSWDETQTFFHEFGHALHNFFADGQFKRTSRSVPRDFVELPSQIMENWAGEPEVLKVYAKHYQTGEPIPDELIEKLQNAEHFNQGFINVEYIAAAFLDMDWHTATLTEDIDVNAFENESMKKIDLIEEIIPRYRTTYFGHIFGSGYAAGYYVYLWAGQLDTDAFEAFKETGDLFNQELAAKFRKHILAENGLGEGMEQYVKFRGKEPSIDPLLRSRGLK